MSNPSHPRDHKCKDKILDERSHNAEHGAFEWLPCGDSSSEPTSFKRRLKSRYGRLDFLRFGENHLLVLDGPSGEWRYEHPIRAAQMWVKRADALTFALHPAVDAAKVDRLLLNDLAPLVGRASAGYQPRRGRRAARFSQDARVAWALVGERLSRDDVLLKRHEWRVLDERVVDWLVEECLLHPWSTSWDMERAAGMLMGIAACPIGALDGFRELELLLYAAEDQLADIVRDVRGGMDVALSLAEYGAAVLRLSQDPEVLGAWLARAAREDEALWIAGLLPAEDRDENVPQGDWNLQDLRLP